MNARSSRSRSSTRCERKVCFADRSRSASTGFRAPRPASVAELGVPTGSRPRRLLGRRRRRAAPPALSGLCARPAVG
ncbi:MAG: hypothetical protein MZW92_18040 [Comamonadaceae bacterium]|nr:hypothetical protein [Comamonadaceae bacterium]